jgi:hypothetical protein
MRSSRHGPNIFLFARTGRGESALVRVIAAAFSFIVAGIVLFIAAYFILCGFFLGWQLPWGEWPRNPSALGADNARAVVVAHALVIVLGAFLAAVVGAFIFAISCLSDGCNAALLGARRAYTFACVFGIAFQILFAVLLEVTCIVVGAYAGSVTGASVAPSVARTMDTAQFRNLVAQHVFETIDQHRLVILLGSAAFAFVFSFWLGNVFAYSDWLPWCNGWVGRNQRHAATQRKVYRRSL